MADDALDYGAAASELLKPAGIAALSTKDADPDKAARALDLSKTTGIPAPVIHADVDSFTDNLKAQSASDLVKNNRQLGAYVASDPMASQVSSDDYAQLDTVSEATSKLAQPGIFQRIGNAVRDIYIDKPIEGFKEGFDYQGQLQERQQLSNYIDSPAWRSLVNTWGIGAAATLLNASSHAFQGVVAGTAAGLGAAYDQLGLQDTLEKITGHPQTREGLVRDLITGAQVAFPPEVGAGHAAEAAFPEVTKAVQAAEKAKPYLLDGKDVPVGVDPLLDQAKKEESKADLEKLKEAMKEAQASTTRDRAPDMFRNFIAQHTGEDTIGISADAVQKLYGDKVPAPGDNLLGFVPDMASQLLRSAATGADVQVPTADLLAHMDPEVFKELEGGIRVREGGVTKEEELPQAQAAEPEQPKPSTVTKGDKEFLDTRGQGQQFHGTSATTMDFDEGHYSTLNYYGQGHYTTDAADVAYGYSKRGSNKTGERNLYQITENKPVKLLDAEAPITPEISDILKKGEGSSEYVSQALEENPKNVRELYDNIRDIATAEGISADTIQETFEGIQDNLVEAGYRGMTHIGGLRTDTAPHKVNIYFRPHEDLTATKGDFEQHVYKAPAPKVIGEVAEAPHDPVQTVRQAAALPMMDKAQAIGMTEAQLAKYSKLIGEQQEADNAAALRRAAAFERRTQTAEWSANRKEMQSDVSQEITQQPVHIADKGLRNGDIPKLDADSLTDDQKSALPKSYFRRGGESPDYVANILGYASGDDMITDLQSLHANRGDIRPGDYITKLISDETDRRMEAKYGKLDENVIEAAKEQVLSETQLDLLHAQTEDLAGGKLPFTKEDLRQSMAKMVGETRLSGINSDAMLAAAGRAGRAVEDALLKGDAAEAFRQRQRQYAAVMGAKEAMKVEKAKAQFDKLAKQYSKREVAGALQEYTNQIHDLLVRLGQPVRRSLQDISESITADGYNTEKGDYFSKFIDAKESSFRELHVPEFLQSPSFRKPVKELTADEFMQTHSALKALAFNARDELKVIRAGEKVDLAAVKSEMVDVLKSLGPERKYRIDKSPNAIAEGLKSFGWSGIQIESMFNRFDRDDPKGVFNQTLVRTYTEAANYKDRLLKQFQEKLNAVGRIPDMDKTVRNDLFVDPITRVPFDMRRRNVLGILQNIGNDSNLRKLAEGYKLDPEVVKQWVLNHTTKEDWDRAQKIGDHFRDIFDMANTMSHNVSGVGIERLPLSPIDTPYGRYDGWYNPISYDPIRPGESKKLLGPNALEQDGYYRATTPQGYTKGRTGYIAPIELNLDIVPVRMRQMIHDVAMRPAIIQLSKFFYDPEFKRAIINYYGDHQAEQMVPFLRDIANSPNFRSKSEGIFNGWMSALTHNVVGTMIGLAESTVMKHGPTALVNSLSQVGTVPWTKEFLGLLRDDPATGNSQWKMAMDKSDELSRRMRNFQEIIAGHGQELKLQSTSSKSLFGDVRSMAQYLGSFPVGVSDLLSAVPTWLAQYKEAIATGEDEGQAKFLADRAVRQAHGSSIITNKPAIARNSNAIASTFATLYGFFSHIMQKQYEIAWRMKESYGLAREGNVGEALAKTPKILGMIFSYVIMPALIEETVSPYTNSDKDSWGKKAAKTLITGMSSSVIGLRDIMYALMNQRDPQGGILSDTMKGFTDPIRDLASGKAFTPAKTGDFLKHMTIATGYATGLTNAKEGKSAEFIWNYFHNQEHPQGPWQILIGLRYGKTEGHSKSFNEWLHNEVGKWSPLM